MKELVLFAAAIFATNSASVAQCTTTPQQTLRPLSGSSGDEFGTSCSIDGDVAVVGSPFADPNSMGGAAVVFRKTPVGWLEEQTLFATDGVGMQRFGASVSIDGDRILIGTPRFSDQVVRSGAAYVFDFDGTTWSQSARLDSSMPVEFGIFGSSVALSGDTAVISGRDAGAPNGAVHIFREVAGSWMLEQRIVDPISESFGFSAAIEADVTVVSACLADGSDSAHIYRRTGTNWQLEQVLVPNYANSDSFAISLAISGNWILAGSSRDNGAIGSAYTFQRTNGVWVERQRLRSQTIIGGALEFGQSVDLDGDTAITTSNDAGHIFRRNGTTFVETSIVQSSFYADHLNPPFRGSPVSVAVSEDLAVIGFPLVDGCPNIPFCNNGAAALIDVETNNCLFEGFCSGDGGDQAGCTDCPCGNNAPADGLGGCLHNEGRSAVLRALGEPIASNDTMVFELTGATTTSFALLVSGANALPASPTNPCFGLDSGIDGVPLLDGLRCVGSGLVRHGVRTTNFLGNVLSGQAWGNPFGLTEGLIAEGGYSIGETRHFQVLYRTDHLAVCGTGINTSNAIRTTILP